MYQIYPDNFTLARVARARRWNADLEITCSVRTPLLKVEKKIRGLVWHTQRRGFKFNKDVSISLTKTGSFKYNKDRVFKSNKDREL